MKLEIRPETLERLKQFDKDITDANVNEFLDMLEEDLCQSQNEEDVSSAFASMTHTSVLTATINGTTIPRPKWVTILKHMLRLASCADTEIKNRLSHLSGLRIVQGIKTGRGYVPIESADISFQGVDSNRSAHAIINIAQTLGYSVTIEYQWRNKEEVPASRRGKTGNLRILNGVVKSRY